MKRWEIGLLALSGCIARVDFRHHSDAASAAVVLNAGDVACDAPYGETRALTFVLENHSPDPLLEVALEVPAPYALGAVECGTSLAAAGRCAIEVLFTSPGGGPPSASELIVTHRAGEVRAPLGCRGSPRAVTVVPLYPANGALWNDHVRVSRPLESDVEQDDVACAPSDAAEARGCVQSGDKRRVLLSGETCAGLTATDALGVMGWRCVASGTDALLIATGLVPAFGLADLVDAAGFRANAVEVERNGFVLFASEPAVWWANPVRPAPVNPGNGLLALDEPNTVYVVAADQPIGGYAITADGVALVTLAGAALSYGGNGTPNCVYPEGDAGGTPDQVCLVVASDQRYLWLEGTFRGDHAAQFGALLYGVTFSVVRHARLADFTHGDYIEGALTVRDGGNILIFDTWAADNATWGVRIESPFNVVVGLDVHGNAGSGLVVEGSDTLDNTVVDVVATGNGDPTLSLTTGGWGIDEYGALSTTYSHVTVANNLEDGLVSQATPAGPTVSHLLGLNNGSCGFASDAPSGVAADLALAANDRGALCIGPQGSDGRFLGELLVDVAACAVDAGAASPGLVDGTCTDTGADGSSGYAGMASTAVLRTGRDLTGAVAGKVLIDDPVSPDDNAGAAAMIGAWWSLSTPLRAWGRDGRAFPDPEQRGRCAGEPCRIWDWQPGPGLLLDATPLTPGAPCPPLASGDLYLDDTHTPPNRFLRHALELLFDGAGDDDGLCESDEACVYAPALGAYHGAGDLTGPCDFVNGAVSGVILWERPS